MSINEQYSAEHRSQQQIQKKFEVSEYHIIPLQDTFNSASDAVPEDVYVLY